MPPLPKPEKPTQFTSRRQQAWNVENKRQFEIMKEDYQRRSYDGND